MKCAWRLPAVISKAIAVATLIAVALICVGAPAQSTASIQGQVTDQNGAVIPGAEIQAISRAIAIARSTVTDDRGRYQISALPVGDYRMEVRARGFSGRGRRRARRRSRAHNNPVKR